MKLVRYSVAVAVVLCATLALAESGSKKTFDALKAFQGLQAHCCRNAGMARGGKCGKRIGAIVIATEGELLDAAQSLAAQAFAGRRSGGRCPSPGCRGAGSSCRVSSSAPNSPKNSANT